MQGFRGSLQPGNKEASIIGQKKAVAASIIVDRKFAVRQAIARQHNKELIEARNKRLQTDPKQTN